MNLRNVCRDTVDRFASCIFTIVLPNCVPSLAASLLRVSSRFTFQLLESACARSVHVTPHTKAASHRLCADSLTPCFYGIGGGRQTQTSKSALRYAFA